MKSLRTSILTIAAAVALAITLPAQQSSPTNQQPNQSMQGMAGMQSDQMQGGQMHGKGMNNMMQGCQKNMQTMMQSNDQATKDIEAAKRSSDPVKMRAALDTAEKALNYMKDHMKTCQSMMDMMQHMQGMGGMMSDQDNQKKQQNTPQQ